MAPQIKQTPLLVASLTVLQTVQPTMEGTIQPTVKVPDVKLTLLPQLPAKADLYTRPGTRFHKVVAVPPQFVFFLPIESKGPLVLFDIAAKSVLTTTFISTRGNPTIPYDLLLGHDGRAWALGEFDGLGLEWVLRWFDPQRMKFVPVQDEKGFLRGDSIQGSQSLCEDTEANLWLIIDDRVIKFSPRTGLSERILLSEVDYHVVGFKPSVDAIQCDDRGKVWLIITQYAQSLHERSYWNLYRLDEPNHHLIDYQSPNRGETYNFAGQFLLDPSSNVWVVDTGFALSMSKFDAIPHWQSIRPPNASFEPGTLFRSSDGRLWMSSYAGPGIVVYNPATTSWQSIAGISSAVGQSQDGDLWTADDKQVYKIITGGQ
jgi:hypothetical protein